MRLVFVPAILRVLNPVPGNVSLEIPEKYACNFMQEEWWEDGIYYLPSHRSGSMVLIFKDNKYWINNRYQNTINWTCRDRKRIGCNSCVQTTVEGRYIKHKGFHNHADNYTKYNFND